jgi:hypothetical protein
LLFYWKAEELDYIPNWLQLPKSIIFSMGLLFFPLQAFELLNNSDVAIPFGWFMTLALIVGIVFYVVDGLLVSGFLKNSVTIKSSGFDGCVTVKFADLFKQDGWKAIGVNDFFDSQVDDVIISRSSLHGQVIAKFWHDDPTGWQQKVDVSLAAIASDDTDREAGNSKRYPIGTTAIAKTHDHKFLFVALSNTEIETNVATANAENLICAVRGMLNKARVVCANEPLNIPLMGSGLGRIGIKNAILVDLILVGIFEEMKRLKVTNSINIILPKEKKSAINLGSISRDWNQHG